MTSWLEWWYRQSGDNWRRWKNGGVSEMEELMQWCWSLDLSIASVHRNTGIASTGYLQWLLVVIYTSKQEKFHLLSPSRSGTLSHGPHSRGIAGEYKNAWKNYHLSASQNQLYYCSMKSDRTGTRTQTLLELHQMLYHWAIRSSRVSQCDRIPHSVIYTMRAARFYGPGDIRVEDIPEPMPKEGQVKVKVTSLLWKKNQIHCKCYLCKDCLVCSRRPLSSVFMDSNLRLVGMEVSGWLDSTPFEGYNYLSMRQRPSRLSSPSTRVCNTGT